MYKRSSVQQFQSNRRILHHIRNLTEITCHQQGKHWAHTFACPLANMLQHLRQEAIGMRQRVIEQLYKVVQFVNYRLFDYRQIIHNYRKIDAKIMFFPLNMTFNSYFYTEI